MMTISRRTALITGTAFAVSTGLSEPALAAPAWRAYNNLSTSGFQAKFDDLSLQGYRLKVVTGYSVSGQPNFAGIWVKVSGPAWRARNGLDAAAYQQIFEQYSQEGYRLRRISVYHDNGIKYAAIWDKGSGPAWAAHHALDQSAFQQQFDALIAQGYQLTNIGVCGSLLGGLTYAGLWEKASGASEARSNLDTGTYQTSFDQLSAQGYRLRQACGYSIFGQPHFATIWDKKPSPAWVAHHNMTTAQFEQTFNQLGAQGYWLTDISGYDIAGQAAFTGIWEKA